MFVTMGGSANDPRWRENGGSWGYRTPEAAARAGSSPSMPEYPQPSQQAFGMPQAAPMAAYRPQQSAPQSGMQAWTPPPAAPRTPPRYSWRAAGSAQQPRQSPGSSNAPPSTGGVNISSWAAPQSGRAQSIQEPSQGTPYTPQQQGPRPSNSAFADAWNFSMEGNASRMAPARTFGGGGAGNLAYMPDNARPDPFTSYAIGPDGRQVSQQQSLNNRDALISALIQDNAQHAGRSGVYQGRGNPPPGFMAPPPPPNIPALWGQAQNAVNNGWVSPAAGLWG